MEITVESICNLLVKSRLLPNEALGGLRQRWLREAGDAAGDASQFTRWLVTNEYITDFQAGRLLKGQADRYFLGPYKLVDRIAAGKSAGIYKAVHKLGQVVAIKVLPPSKVKDAEAFGRFKREARLATRLQHPNIVRAFQTGEADGLHFIVMEYLEGETLEAVLQRRGRLPASEAARLIYQALLGLEHLHEHGLVHRDLKPDNLMLVQTDAMDSTRNATVKIVDIGLCRALFEENAAVDSHEELTAAGSLLGGGDYRPPEQSRDARQVDIRSDIYALGCVFYRCLTGQTPFADSNPVRQVLRHVKEPPRPLRDFEPTAPVALQKIVATMLAKDPALRFPTPARAAEAVLSYLTGAQETVRLPETPAQMQAYLAWLAANNPPTTATPAAGIPVASLIPQPTERRRLPKPSPRWIGVAVSLLLVAGATAWVWPKRSPAPTSTPADVSALPRQAQAILEKHCFRCHGRDGASKGQVNYILNRDLLVRRGKVMPNNAEQSRLYQLICSQEMPPESIKERPTAAEVAILKQWIDAGAPSWSAPLVQRHLDYAHILNSIHDDLLLHVPEAERKHYRYFTLTHIYNQTELRKDLPLYRAGLVKLLNSLSWQPKIVVPREIDPEQTIYAVNLKSLGWTSNLWELEVLGRYPYGLRHDGKEQNEQLAATAKEVYALTATLQPFVRADWFLARASRPPAYHSLLFHTFPMPESAATLERELGIDVTDNIRKNNVVRAGYFTSNISAQNRLVERHTTKYGAYWKSYDFGPNNDRRNLLKFPLGPAGALVRYGDFAFKHDGAEIIFNLPNGLQAYFLADGLDSRLDEAPLAIVRDKDKRHSGSEVIVNGPAIPRMREKAEIGERFRKVAS